MLINVSLLLFFQTDKQKEWIYKGSDKLEHIVNIKKRLGKDKPEQTSPQRTEQSPQPKTQQPDKTGSFFCVWYSFTFPVSCMNIYN